MSENEGLPGDRRVWDECRALTAAGWQVDAVCPQAVAGAQPPEDLREGIRIHRFGLRPGAGPLGYLREYGQAGWRIAGLVRRLRRRDGDFDVVHVANPPDFLHLAVRAAGAGRVPLVFDHHDLAPELFEARFGRTGLPHRALLALERHALRSAAVVIATNESVRRVAIERGGVPPERVFVVRNGPELERFTPVLPDPALRRGRRHLLAYVGVMGPQDGIDHLLGALAALRRLRADDWRAILIGDGEVLGEMRARAAALGLAEQVGFAGWRGDAYIRRVLSTADVCLAPDPPSPLNHASTMVKVPEYMAMGRAIASYDLRETRVSAGPAAAYAGAGEPASLARCVHELLESPERRRAMGRIGRERVAELSWERSREVLLRAYERAAAGAGGADRARPGRGSSSGRVAIADPAGGPGDQLR